MSFQPNTIYCGDNKEVLRHFPENCADLIYLDPPFFSNKHYEIIWKDGYELRAFADRWKGGINNYIAWMEERLAECKRVLKEDGSIYIHCDYHASHYLKVMMDKLFGENNFRNEIIWYYGPKASQKYPTFQEKHDTIFLYSKTNSIRFNKLLQEYSEGTLEERKTRFKFADAKGRYRMTTRRDSDGKKYRAKVYLHEGVSMDDVWEINVINATSKERLGYPTQKPEELLDRIIRASSKEHDVVLDPFCGCGTAIAVAHKLGRRWVGIDVSPTACKLMTKRMRSIGAKEFQVIGLPKTVAELKTIQPFEFQNWVFEKLYARVNPRKTGDFGLDGWLNDGSPVQVKQSEDVGRNVVDNFETAMRRSGRKKGMIVAFSFGKGAYEEVARVKIEEGLEIILKTVQEILDET
ncbi:MAG: DNA methyltransferase [Nitrososphaerales archaeon]